MDANLNAFLYRVMVHKKNNTIVGKVVGLPDKAESTLEAEVTLRLKSGSAKSVRISDLRDASKSERKEYEGKH